MIVVCLNAREFSEVVHVYGARTNPRAAESYMPRRAAAYTLAAALVEAGFDVHVTAGEPQIEMDCDTPDEREAFRAAVRTACEENGAIVVD